MQGSIFYLILYKNQYNISVKALLFFFAYHDALTVYHDSRKRIIFLLWSTEISQNSKN